MNARNIHELSKMTGAPVVWRFNDLNAFTGGCHYSNGCTNYHTGCGNCPALLHPSTKDRSWRNAQAKMHWLGQSRLCFVSSTSEIDEQLKSSAVAKVCRTRLVMLSCQSKNFRPADKKNAAIELGLPPHKQIIFFGANDLSDPRKGFSELVQSLELLKAKLTREQQEKILLVYASKATAMQVSLPFPSIQLPFLNGDDQLAKVYQAATLFVSPSIEDAGPMMLLESILCGTPTIAYAIGLARDAVINNVTGFIVPPADVDKFAEGIKAVVQMPAGEYASLSRRCHQRGIDLFSEKRELAEYEELFAELIKSNGNDR
ncbi:MAG: glycosyltransferase [Chitinophagaceae bacterium]|nr:MAG: glycosyltransferase [Chitinophagaceae bacterium]